MRVACFTVAVMDRFPRQDAFFAGGNALNQAVRFARLGWDASFLGAVGKDVPGDQLASLLQENGVDISHLARVEGATASNTIVNDSSGERFSVDGTWAGGVYEDFRLSGRDWAYLENQDLWITHANCPDFLESLERKPDRVRMAVDFLHLTDIDLIRCSLPSADILYFGGTAEMEPLLRELSRESGKLLVLTLGAGGSIAFMGEAVYRQSALPLDPVVDTTGCGDAFQAAFSDSYFRHGDIPQALQAGAVAGRENARHHGATLKRGV